MPENHFFPELVREALQLGASDVHLSPNRHPSFRINGEIHSQPQKQPVLRPEDTKDILFALLDKTNQERLARDWELDTGLIVVSNEGMRIRLRANIRKQYGGWAGSFRLIPEKIPSPEDLLMEPCIADLINFPSGLVLFTGPTGAGKTTSLACLLEQINQRQRRHILTIEDPIEYLYHPQHSEITQREVGTHTQSFPAALRSALRSDPDVLMIGEMRDLESIQLALTASETGQLVFSTLHTSDASQTINRIIDVFPAAQQSMVRTQLSNVLQAVVSQILLPTVRGGGRQAVREILLPNTAIRTLIREDNIHQIYNALGSGSALGMQTMESALIEKVRTGTLDIEWARRSANRLQTFETLYSK